MEKNGKKFIQIHLRILTISFHTNEQIFSIIGFGTLRTAQRRTWTFILKSKFLFRIEWLCSIAWSAGFFYCNCIQFRPKRRFQVLMLRKTYFFYTFLYLSKSLQNSEKPANSYVHFHVKFSCSKTTADIDWSIYWPVLAQTPLCIHVCIHDSLHSVSCMQRRINNLFQLSLDWLFFKLPKLDM